MASILHENSGWAGAKVELRRAAKCAAASFFGGMGIRQALSAWERKRVGGRRVLIVSYHRVVGDFREAVTTSIPGLLVSQRTFERLGFQVMYTRAILIRDLDPRSLRESNVAAVSR